MKRALSCTLTLLAATLAVAPARANDTMADLKAGGLVFVTTDNVEMASEDLYLSPHAVKVDYVFHNSGDKDQTSVVAFPMPDVEGSGDFMVSVPDDGADNFMDFSVTIEGQPVTPEIDRHAFAAEVDVTALLTAHAIPADLVEIDFDGADMSMGYNRPRLAFQGEKFSGTTILPVCITGSMTWKATVLASIGGERIAVPFLFEVAGR